MHLKKTALRRIQTTAATVAVFLLGGSVSAATLEVGPEKMYDRIEAAAKNAWPGDVILVYPQKDNQPYQRTAVLVRQKKITIRAAATKAGRVKISGKGFDYSGVGRVPRAVFQFDPGADNCTLKGFDISGAHNDSHNGAAVRINQADNVTISNCEIHHNDMGVMSGGGHKPGGAKNQLIEGCVIHHNGDPTRPGYNHNLYLAGNDATLRFCEVHSSLTGQNVKSRAHHTRVLYCYIHDSANREFDLVDSDETARPESHAALIGNIVVKAPRCRGNRAVIHFGQDGRRRHDGTLYLAFNTIVTPYVSPLVELSAEKTGAYMLGNLISDGGAKQENQTILSVRNGARRESLTGDYNWFSGGFADQRTTELDARSNIFDRADRRLFVDPSKHDFHLQPWAFETAVVPGRNPRLPGGAKIFSGPLLLWQYNHPAGMEKRPVEKEPTMGAFGQKKSGEMNGTLQ